jgi:hypothetical protein
MVFIFMYAYWGPIRFQYMSELFYSNTRRPLVQLLSMHLMLSFLYRFCWPLYFFLSFIFWLLYCLSFIFWLLYCLSFIFWLLYCLSFIFWLLYCLSFIFWLLYCLSFIFWLLYCLSFSIYGLCLLYWNFQTFLLKWPSVNTSNVLLLWFSPHVWAPLVLF